MELYIFEDYKRDFPEREGEKRTDSIMKEALACWGEHEAAIGRTEKGKPYIIGRDDLFISVSHSGSMCACLIDRVPVGVDIQQRRPAAGRRIAERFFTETETEEVENGGEDMFFRLWARKEAYSKYTGNGLQDVMKGISVLDRDDVTFSDMKLEDDMFCSCCRRNEREGK